MALRAWCAHDREGEPSRAAKFEAYGALRMIEVLYRYRVHAAQVRAFEHAYGPDGPWAALFRRHPGFRRLRLFRSKNESGIYIAVDVWESKADWEAFRSANAWDYARLDRDLRMLYLEELLLGYYEGDEEYQPPLDTTV